MGLFGSIGAVFGKSSGGKKGRFGQDTSKPFHTHGESKTSDAGAIASAAISSGGNDPILEAGLGQNAGGPPPVPNGIDNGQYEQEFMEKRGGVGISETPDVQLGTGGQVGVPVPPPDVDKMGVNSLY
jgi:hypothetical protein